VGRLLGVLEARTGEHASKKNYCTEYLAALSEGEERSKRCSPKR
jgi:hypothetical protein